MTRGRRDDESWCTLPPTGGRARPRGQRIENRSRYRDEDVRRFIRAGLRAYGVRRDVAVVVRPAPGRTRGCATLSGDALVVAVARPSKWSQRKAALILRHECAHLHGVDHAQMSPDIHWSRGPCPKWARALPMRRKRSKKREER